VDSRLRGNDRENGRTASSRSSERDSGPALQETKQRDANSEECGMKTDATGSGGTGRKILIIDDEPDVITYLETFFNDHGFVTIAAPDGKVGFAKAKAERPDLITLDISMPEESGVKMFRQLQDDPATKDIPVIIVTGISSDFERFIRSRKQVHPPDGYFEKPIDKEALLKKIQEILGA
jgi:CheY-like chemotaxis protein